MGLVFWGAWGYRYATLGQGNYQHLDADEVGRLLPGTGNGSHTIIIINAIIITADKVIIVCRVFEYGIAHLI